MIVPKVANFVDLPLARFLAKRWQNLQNRKSTGTKNLDQTISHEHP
jgi:hypothetical protein